MAQTTAISAPGILREISLAPRMTASTATAVARA
jgi:hypothetical protein